MKKISKTVWIVLLLAGMLMGISSPALAGYTIDWMYVQHRVYENGNAGNRFSFGVVDGAGQRVTDFRDFKDLRLYDPSGSAVSLSNGRIWMDEGLGGYYDSDKGQWKYNEFAPDASVSFDLPGVPVSGTYRMELTSSDDTVCEATCDFGGTIDLPLISSQSFRFSADSSPNLFWYWDVPEELGRLSAEYSTQTRVCIDIYKENQYIGYMSIRSPAHMGYCFIPADVVQKIIAKGDEFRLYIQLRTKDNTNRSYSESLIVK